MQEKLAHGRPHHTGTRAMVRCVGKVGKKQSRFLIGVIFTQISWYCAANLNCIFLCQFSIEFMLFMPNDHRSNQSLPCVELLTLPMHSRVAQTEAIPSFNSIFCFSNIWLPARGNNLCIKDAHTPTACFTGLFILYLFILYPKTKENEMKEETKILCIVHTQCTAVVVHILLIFGRRFVDCSSRSIVKVIVTCALRAACVYVSLGYKSKRRTSTHQFRSRRKSPDTRIRLEISTSE